MITWIHKSDDEIEYRMITLERVIRLDDDMWLDDDWLDDDWLDNVMNRMTLITHDTLKE